MIEINHYSTQKDNNDDKSPHENDYRSEHDNVTDNRNRRDHNGGNRTDHNLIEDDDRRSHGHNCDEPRHFERENHCCPKIKAPVVLAPIVAVAAGTTIIGAFPDRVAIQILNNLALIATYTVVLQPLKSCETGYVVIETATGITALAVQGVSNVSATALTTAGSYITLMWNGCVWVQV